MRVSTLGNSRPVFGERTNARVQYRVKPTQSPKQVSFSPALAGTENSPTLSTTKKGKALQSALRPVRRYGNNKALATNQGAKLQRSLSQRLAAERRERERELEPDTAILTKVASLLESKLSDIKDAHQEALLEIEVEKKKKMEKIYLECVIEQKLARHKEKMDDETFAHDLAVMQETIATLRDNNDILRRENKELIDEMDEIKHENKRLFEKTASYNKAILKIKAEIAEEEKNNAELQSSFDFLKMRKTQYENSRFLADQDIEDEHEQAMELRKKLERVVAEIDNRCTERRFSDAVKTAVSKDLARVDAKCA